MFLRHCRRFDRVVVRPKCARTSICKHPSVLQVNGDTTCIQGSAEGDVAMHQASRSSMSRPLSFFDLASIAWSIATTCLWLYGRRRLASVHFQLLDMLYHLDCILRLTSFGFVHPLGALLRSGRPRHSWSSIFRFFLTACTCPSYSGLSFLLPPRLEGPSFAGLVHSSTRYLPHPLACPTRSGSALSARACPHLSLALLPAVGPFFFSCLSPRSRNSLRSLPRRAATSPSTLYFS